MPVKDIRFDYFQVYCKHYDKEKDEVSFLIFDLEPILEQAARLDAVQRTYQYYDEESRLQKVFPDNLNGTRIWGMQFLRIRKNLIPGIATDDGAYEPLELREGEYIGEEASALYDPQYCVLMLQRNRNSLSPTGIEAFFNKAWEEHTIQLRPIILPEDYIQFTEDDFYRCITVSFADVKTSQINGRSSLMKLLEVVEDYGGINAEIRISLGKKGKKDQTLNRREIIDTINDFKHRSDVKKLEIRKKESPDAKVESFDLVEHRLHDYISFQYSRKDGIHHERVYPKMRDIFERTRQFFEEILRKAE